MGGGFSSYKRFQKSVIKEKRSRGFPRERLPSPHGKRGAGQGETDARLNCIKENTTVATGTRERKPVTGTMSSEETKYFEQKVQVTIHIEQNLG